MANNRRPCPGLWKTPVIRHDGQLMACCADVDGEIEVGNLREHSFQELWEGPIMTQYRRWHIRGEFENMPKCVSCGGINWIEMSETELKDYLDEIGSPEDFALYLKRLAKGQHS